MASRHALGYWMLGLLRPRPWGTALTHHCFCVNNYLSPVEAWTASTPAPGRVAHALTMVWPHPRESIKSCSATHGPDDDSVTSTPRSRICALPGSDPGAEPVLLN